MKLHNLTLTLFFVFLILSCNSSNNKEENNKEENNKEENNKEENNQQNITDTIYVKDLSEGIVKIKESSIPFIYSIQELTRMNSVNNIFLDIATFSNDIGEFNSCKLITTVNLSSDIKLLLVYTFSDQSEFGNNYYYLVVKNNIITTVSDPFFLEDLTDGREFMSIGITNKENPIIKLSYKNEILYCLDTTGLGLTSIEKENLLTDTYKYEIDTNGKINYINEVQAQQNNNDENQLLVFEGKIGNDDVLMQLFKSGFYDYHGKIFVKNKNIGFLMGKRYQADMCFSEQYSMFSSSGESFGFLDAIFGDEVYGHYQNKEDEETERLPVRMKKSDKSFEELVPNSVLLKIKDNPDFKDYISRFAESKENFALDYKALDFSGANLMPVDKEYAKKFIMEKYLVSSYKTSGKEFTYNYGFVFDNNIGLTCIIPVKINYLMANEGQYRYMFVDYTYKGEIKSIDIIDELPQNLSMRGYEYSSDEPKNLFNQQGFGNDIMTRIDFYIDIPADTDIDSIFVYEQTGEDFTETKNEKARVFTDKLFAYDHPHIYFFKLQGTLGCNDLYFEIINTKGKIIFDKKFDMHCGE